MELKIRDIRSLKRADLPLEGFTLVAGKNGAGKTTINHALAAVLAGQKRPFGTVTDSVEGMIRQGEKIGGVKLELGDGKSRTMQWRRTGQHKEQMSEEGPSTANGPTASRIALGLDSFGEMEPTGRAQLLSRTCQTLPTEKDLKQALEEAGIDIDIQKLWQAIEVDGWDVVSKARARKATEFKGAWQENTKEKWGKVKAADWGRDVEGNIEELNAELETLTNSIYEQSQILALSDEERATAQNAVDGIEIAEAELAKTNDEIQKIQFNQNQIHIRLSELPASATAMTCPCCEEKVIIEAGHLIKFDGEANDKAIAERTKLNDNASELGKRFDELQIKRAAFENDLKLGREAKARLARASGEVDQDAVAQLKHEQDAIQALVSKLNARDRAAELHKQILKQIDLAKILGPDGLRKQKLTGALEIINGRIADMSAQVGMPGVRIDPDMSLHWGRISYLHMSKSQQWRANLCVQLSLAQIDKSSVICVDGIDILGGDGPSRGPLFKLLNEQDVPVIGLMTCGFNNDGTPKCPDLSERKLGRTMLIVDGELADINGVLEVKEAA